MNVCLKGNLAQTLVIHIDALLTPKKKATLPLASTLFCLISRITYIVLQGRKQIPSLRQTVSLFRENINIFINVTYLYMLHVCIYKMHNMIRFFCTKVKFYIKYLFGTRLHYFKELMIFISNL